MSGSPSDGLGALEARLAQDLSWLELPAKTWVEPLLHEGNRVQDVVIIGAGMSGLAAASAMRMLGIEPLVLDQASEGVEGPWVTTARMETLRSPKQLTGPALGISTLTFRAWFEAQHGLAQWQVLDKIPRVQWMDYLRWYRAMVVRYLGVQIRNSHRLVGLNISANNLVELKIEAAGVIDTLLARRAVLATGRDGLGAAWFPEFAKHISSHLRAHSSDKFEYATLHGKRVAVIGAGASAMDSAATALESGAAKVDLLIRRKEMPRINKGKGAGNAGLTNGFQHLPNEWKWRIRRYIQTQQVPPPRGSTLRVARHPQAAFHLGCPVLDVKENSAQSVSLLTRKGWSEYDMVFFATGFRVDFSSRSEFAALDGKFITWGEYFTPPQGDTDDELSAYPVLGDAFEFKSRSNDLSSVAINRVHCFCYPAVMSHGQVSGDIPAVSDGAKHLAQGIANLFYQEDIAAYYKRMENYAEPELLGDEWKEAP